MTAQSELESVLIKATKGNELTSMVIEEFTAGVFQSTIAAGVGNQNLAIRLRNTVAALGCRGDYIEMICYIGVLANGQIPNVNTHYIEAVDYSGVPVAVQHTVFGKYSPFVTPKEPMNESMMDGIDRQELSVINDVAIAAADALTTAKSLTIRGSLDSRITSLCDNADETALEYIAMRFKPNADGVFMFRAGARIWADPDDNAMG